MPFKGDRRLGGPHDNEAHLNGTSSEFDSVPAYGTLLSGPTDTSRYESDATNTAFMMPYSTSVYADGVGGQYSVETWGLQYFPAGWVTSIGSNPVLKSWDFTMQCDETLSTSGNAQYGNEVIHNVEDGTGINTPYVHDVTIIRNDGEIITSYNNGGTDKYRVVWSSSATDWVLQDYTCEPTYGTILGYVSGNLYASTATCGSLVVGTYYGVELADGYGGASQNVANTYVPNGDYLGVCGTMPNWEAWYYSDGNGGMYTSYAPQGFTLSDTTSSSSFTWYAPDGSTGSFSYATSYETIIANGSGGQNVNSGGWNAAQHDVITSGQYSYDTGQVDENNDPIYAQGFYSIKYDGNGGYYTDTWS